MSGQRSHLGEVVATAVWPAILDLETSVRLRAVLLDPARGERMAGRRYLLTSKLAFCGLCRGPPLRPAEGRRASLRRLPHRARIRGCGPDEHIGLVYARDQESPKKGATRVACYPPRPAGWWLSVAIAPLPAQSTR